MHWFQNIWQWLDTHTGWATEITGAAIILLLTALVHWFWRRLHGRISEGLERTETVWDDALFRALQHPLSLTIWCIGLTFAAQFAFEDRVKVINSAVGNIRNIVIVMLLGWFLVRFIREGENQLIASCKSAPEEGRLDATTISALSKLGRIAVLIVIALIMMDTLGFSISGILAFGGIGGLAISFAAKDLLANFFGGLMLYLDRPFAIGDSIRSPDRELEGTVEHIGWRQTKIRTLEKRALYVPNAVFPTIAVENITRMSQRRIREYVGVRYQDAAVLPALLAAIQHYLKVHPELVKDDALVAHFVQFADSSLNIMVNAHTEVTDWAQFHRLKEQVLLQILAIIHQHGADVAFPTRTVLLEHDGQALKHGS
jgi:MscS family membrane protein